MSILITCPAKKQYLNPNVFGETSQAADLGKAASPLLAGLLLLLDERKRDARGLWRGESVRLLDMHGDTVSDYTDISLIVMNALVEDPKHLATLRRNVWPMLTTFDTQTRAGLRHIIGLTK